MYIDDEDNADDDIDDEDNADDDDVDDDGVDDDDGDDIDDARRLARAIIVNNIAIKTTNTHQ